ncbi:MAG TPA: spore germination protein GerW family protein [Nocardioidaceae bacterium]|nr:spore germination protein GerW family protein [Nocardioidaceae bacterium]
MNITEVLSTAKDAITVKRVYGEPYEKDGLTVIPVATVGGGGGGGTGHDEKGEENEGAGFGMGVRPVGAYVVQGQQVTWRPAVDVNRIVAVVGMVIVAYLLSRPRLMRAKARMRSGD